MTDVVFTHLHVDHIGGLLVDGRRIRLRPLETEYQVAPGVLICRTGGGHTPGHIIAASNPESTQ